MSELPISYDNKSKKLSLSTIPDENNEDLLQLKLDVDQLNTLTQEIINQGSDVPPQPKPENFNKDLSKMIKSYTTVVSKHLKLENSKIVLDNSL